MTVYDDEVLADAPWGYWPLNEGSGTTAIDASGNSRNATWTAAPTYLAAGPPGAPDGANVPAIHNNSQRLSAPAYTPGTAATLEAWLKVPDARARYAFYWAASTTSTNRMLLHPRWSDGNIYWDYGAADGNGRLALAWPGGNTDWHHYVFRADGSEQSIWMDGTQVATGVRSASPSATAGTMVLLNDVASLVDQNMSVCRMALYPTGLSDSRILTHYEAHSKRDVSWGTLGWNTSRSPIRY